MMLLNAQKISGESLFMSYLYIRLGFIHFYWDASSWRWCCLGEWGSQQKSMFLNTNDFRGEALYRQMMFSFIFLLQREVTNELLIEAQNPIAYRTQPWELQKLT